MSQKNYSKFSQHFKKTENEENKKVEDVNNVTMNEVFNEVMDEIVDEKPVEKVDGVVTGCAKLNVRKEAKMGTTVLCVLTKGDDIVVDLENSTEDFYKVCTSSGVEGYCMKTYISVN